MQIAISKIVKAVTQHILGLTLYHMMQSSQDFEDVWVALHDRMGWSIEIFRSCFTIHLGGGGCFFTLCALTFSVMAENIYIHYGRLPPRELKERAERIGYATFAILFAVLDIGVVIVRVAGLVALSGTPGLAAGLVIVSMSPLAILLMLTYPARLVRWRERQPTSDAEMNPVDETGD